MLLSEIPQDSKNLNLINYSTLISEVNQKNHLFPIFVDLHIFKQNLEDSHHTFAKPFIVIGQERSGIYLIIYMLFPQAPFG